MIVLIIHQNFPGQYLHLARHLGALPEHKVLFLTQLAGPAIPGVEQLLYAAPAPALPGTHPFAQAHDAAVRTALAVLAACRALQRRGVVPDLVIGHSGWGETLLVKQAFPQTPLLAYFEFYYHALGADVGFDPEFAPSRPDDAERLWLRNSTNLLSMAACDAGHTPTEWQRSLFPASLQRRITVLHEGVDTEEVRPDSQAEFILPGGTVVHAGDELITFVARNLEPYRGFHCLLRALPTILLARPCAQVLLVGGEHVSYGDLPPYGGSWKALLLAELGDRLDRRRVHFLGHLTRPDFLRLLHVSRLHVYFSYPFVLSWSCLEALAAGCLVLGSDVAPIREVIRHGENGLLVDMRDRDAVARSVIDALAAPDGHGALRAAARRTAEETFDLQRVILPQWMHTLTRLSAR